MAEKTKYMMSHHQNSGQNQNVRVANELFENVAKFKYLGMALTNQMAFMMKSRVDQIRVMLAIIQTKIMYLPSHITKTKDQNIQKL
jgi:hypothetical protein